MNMTEHPDYDEEVNKKLIKYFFKGSLQYTLCPKDIETLTWYEQKKFLDATVNSQLIKKYPVNTEFSRLFFKKLIDYLEPIHEVHDDCYTYLCSVMKMNFDKYSFCYRHYIVGNDLRNIITIKETNNMVVNGTTGMRTWQAALMLSDWALCNRDLFNCKKIIELGSGVGFTGVTIAKLCQIYCITLTDCHNDVLTTICENIEINFPDTCREQSLNKTLFRYEQKTLEVMPLDWNCIDNLPTDEIPDVVIGADIIYDPIIIEPLCNVIKVLLDRNKLLEVYIANIIRNEDTYMKFLLTLDSMNLSHMRISQSQSVFIEWDQNMKTCLLKIINKSTYTSILNLV